MIPQLGWIKEYIPLILYSSGLAAVLLTFYKRTVGLYFLILIVPLVNVREQINELPQGKNLIDFLLLAIVIDYVIERLRGEAGLVKLFQHKIFVAYIIVTYLYLWWGSFYLSLDLPVALDNERFTDWKNHVLCILIYFMISSTIKRKKQMLVVIVLMFLTMFYADRVFVGSAHTSGDFRWDRRGEGIFSYLGPNEMAAFFVDYVFIPIGLFLHVNRLIYRVPLGILIGFTTYVLLFTYSRGAYIAFVVGLLFVLFKSKKWLIVPLIILVLFWKVLVPAPVVQRIEMTQESGELESSSLGRLRLWQHGMTLAAQNPFGYGYGTIGYLGFRSSDGDIRGDPHNRYIESLVETGIGGLILLCTILLLALRSALRLGRCTKDPFFKGLGLGFFGCVISVMITNFFGDRWTYVELSVYFWVVWALVEGAIAIEDGRSKVVTEI